jgi:hypothetical protein
MTKTNKQTHKIQKNRKKKAICVGHHYTQDKKNKNKNKKMQIM